MHIHTYWEFDGWTKIYKRNLQEKLYSLNAISIFINYKQILQGQMKTIYPSAIKQNWGKNMIDDTIRMKWSLLTRQVTTMSL